MRAFVLAMCGVASGLWHGPAAATQLRVEPILLEMNAPTAAGTLTIRNDQDIEVSVQTRVFAWRQKDGRETLEPTTDVVASPPVVKLAPRTDYVVRVVRVAKRPVEGEESYRVLIDQLPDLRRQNDKAVNILVRQSIPIFFRAPRVSIPKVTWALKQDSGKLVINANNQGDERLRIASLRLQDEAGHLIDFGNGLVGYALGRSTMAFEARLPREFSRSGQVTITAVTNRGALRAVVSLDRK